MLSTTFNLIPSWVLRKKHVVKFLEDDSEKVFPEAMVC